MLQTGDTIRIDRPGALREAHLGRRWVEARDQFLAAIDPRQSAAVAELLRQPRRGGLGLRMWLRDLVTQGRPIPATLPARLIQVYLDDAEAVPLHDCADCGLAVPVHPGCHGYEEEPERVYFAACPCCGGATGLYAYWSNPIRH